MIFGILALSDCRPSVYMPCLTWLKSKVSFAAIVGNGYFNPARSAGTKYILRFQSHYFPRVVRKVRRTFRIDNCFWITTSLRHLRNEYRQAQDSVLPMRFNRSASRRSPNAKVQPAAYNLPRHRQNNHPTHWRVR